MGPPLECLISKTRYRESGVKGDVDCAVRLVAPAPALGDRKDRKDQGQKQGEGRCSEGVNSSRDCWLEKRSQVPGDAPSFSCRCLGERKRYLRIVFARLHFTDGSKNVANQYAYFRNLFNLRTKAEMKKGKKIHIQFF